MRRIVSLAALCVVLLPVLPEGPASLTPAPMGALAAAQAVPATTGVPTPPIPLERPLVVPAALDTNTRGWSTVSGGSAMPASLDLSGDLLTAYSTAAALAPSGCRMPVSLLAAIGQVESGNLAGHRLDASHRVVPAILGPVLDGHGVSAVRDTDKGRLDGSSRWDRALGPLQLTPASWRVAGVDVDGDGRRDPQNIYDAAGAVMVYLCTGERDLGTTAGLRSGVLSFNHSLAYLKQVLAWKTIFDRSDLTLLTPTPLSFGAWAAPRVSAAAAAVSVSAALPRAAHAARLAARARAAAARSRRAPVRSAAAPNSLSPQTPETPQTLQTPQTPQTPGNVSEPPVRSAPTPAQTPTKVPGPTSGPTTSEPAPRHPADSPGGSPAGTAGVPASGPVQPLPPCPVLDPDSPEAPADLGATAVPPAPPTAVPSATPPGAAVTSPGVAAVCTPVLDPVTGLPVDPSVPQTGTNQPQSN